MFEKLSDRYTKIFERPAPKLVCNKSVIEAVSPPDFFHDDFIIKNEGGGILEGDIFAQSSFIALSTQIIEGNDAIIEFEIDLRHMSVGENFVSQIVMTTSGGQIVIPIVVAIEQYSIKCGRFKINSLEEFCACVRAIPEEAAALFVTEGFEKWLVACECKHMEFYRKMVGQQEYVGIKEMDSFLTACGLKEKALITVNRTVIEVELSLSDEKPITESVLLEICSWGAVEYSAYTQNNSPWLRLRRDLITNENFIKDEYLFKIYIDPMKMTGTKCFDVVVFESAQEKLEVNVVVTRPKLFRIELSRLSYRSEDSGYIIIENFTGKNAMVEVTSSENFVRFRSQKYFVDEQAEIPFEIKVNSFLNLGLGKKPINVSEVFLKAVIDGKVYKNTLIIKAGSL